MACTLRRRRHIGVAPGETHRCASLVRHASPSSSAVSQLSLRSSAGLAQSHERLGLRVARRDVDQRERSDDLGRRRGGARRLLHLQPHARRTVVQHRRAAGPARAAGRRAARCSRPRLGARARPAARRSRSRNRLRASPRRAASRRRSRPAIRRTRPSWCRTAAASPFLRAPMARSRLEGGAGGPGTLLLAGTYAFCDLRASRDGQVAFRGPSTVYVREQPDHEQRRPTSARWQAPGSPPERSTSSSPARCCASPARPRSAPRSVRPPPSSVRGRAPPSRAASPPRRCASSAPSCSSSRRTPHDDHDHHHDAAPRVGVRRRHRGPRRGVRRRRRLHVPRRLLPHLQRLRSLHHRTVHAEPTVRATLWRRPPRPRRAVRRRQYRGLRRLLRALHRRGGRQRNRRLRRGVRRRQHGRLRRLRRERRTGVRQRRDRRRVR